MSFVPINPLSLPNFYVMTMNNVKCYKTAYHDHALFLTLPIPDSLKHMHVFFLFTGRVIHVPFVVFRAPRDGRSRHILGRPACRRSPQQPSPPRTQIIMGVSWLVVECLCVCGYWHPTLQHTCGILELLAYNPMCVRKCTFPPPTNPRQYASGIRPWHSNIVVAGAAASGSISYCNPLVIAGWVLSIYC